LDELSRPAKTTGGHVENRREGKAGRDSIAAGPEGKQSNVGLARVESENHARCAGNPKSETRNPKQSPNSKKK
jgi:hypothetical protein